MDINLEKATGRRKTSIARVFLREGSGSITINQKTVDKYFLEPSHQALVRNPLELTNKHHDYDVFITVKGGGVAGQSKACAHGISRALVNHDEANRANLRSVGLLTRDSRMVERKKYGRRGARRRFQFSKR